MEQRGIFMQQAKKIGSDLSHTFLKLEQLSMSKFNIFLLMIIHLFSLVAKQSSLFNDKSMEIQDLTLSIKQDISHLNRQIAQLQQVEFFLFLFDGIYCFGFLVYERYASSEIEEFSNTFQLCCFCFTSKYFFFDYQIL
jgi:hypothetical protein